MNKGLSIAILLCLLLCACGKDSEVTLPQAIRYTVYKNNQEVTYVTDDKELMTEVVEALNNAKSVPEPETAMGDESVQITFCGV